MGVRKKSDGVDLKDVKIQEGFWKKYTDLIRNTVIPYQWDALNDRIADAEPSYAVRNFRIAAGEENGEFGGLVFQDSDAAKWLEAVGYSLAVHPDPELEKAADSLIDLIEKAQHPDGYINTYYTLKEPGNRWTNLLECHELYCAGHMIEAAVSYFKGTGKTKLLEIMCRFADYIDTVFGTEPGKLSGYDGHEEVELALVKLYNATGNKKYLKLAEYFIDQRGEKPFFFLEEWKNRGGMSYWQKGISPEPDTSYNQAHEPVRKQKDAVGHSVRAVYLYTGMADLAAEKDDKELASACRALWSSIADRQMYITGGIGSTYQGEAFTFDYDLPNDTAYQETCASIGLIFFAHRMLKLEPRGTYADVLERALYNSVISGMSQDGKSFFYVNPLEVYPEACEKDPGKSRVKPVRQKWYGCACCPPNVSRLLASLGSYIYTSNENTIYTHLYIEGEAKIKTGGSSATILQKTSYPWSGEIALEIREIPEKSFTLALRIPGWCRQSTIAVNGQEAAILQEDGYAMIQRDWKAGDTVMLNLDMAVEMIQANPLVRENTGKIALQRGPLVYCLEEADNGRDLAAVKLDSAGPLEAAFEPDLLGGAVVITGNAVRTEISGWKDKLYCPLAPEKTSEFRFRAIPYYLWANRGLGEMQVWSGYR